jgi:hypothetical protein
MSISIGVNNVARDVKKCYIGDENGKARKVKKVYIGDENNKAKLVWQSIIEAGSIKFTESTTWTVPSGMKKIDIFVVGGGGGAGGSYKYVSATSSWSEKYYYGSCGAGGYTATKLSYDVTPGQVLNITVGKGGAAGLYYYYQNDNGTVSNFGTTTSSSGMTNGSAGGTSKVVLNGTTIISADGGNGGIKGTPNAYYVNGVNGGSGSSSGGAMIDDNGAFFFYFPGPEGSNGGNGSKTGFNNVNSGQYNDPYLGTPGRGQGTTTKEFGESNGFMYSTAGANTNDAQANTGHGGGHSNSRPNKGADGIVIIRWATQEV